MQPQTIAATAYRFVLEAYRKKAIGLKARPLLNLLTVVLALNLAACENKKSMEPLAVTQCFKSAEQPFNRKDEFYLDNERRCYAQRWWIPRAYYSHVSSKSGPNTGTLVIKVGLPAMTPGAFLSREQDVPLFTEVKMDVLLSGSFARLRHDAEKGYKKIPTEHMLYGMRVYDTKIFPGQKFRGAWLFPDTDAQLFVTYLVTPDQKVNEPKAHSACTITSNVDDRVFLRYDLRCSNMPNLQKINTDLITLVRSFMVNEKTATQEKP